MASSTPSRSDAVSPPCSAGSPNLSNVLSRKCKIGGDSDDSKKQSQAVDDSLVGWWCGITDYGKDPFGHIIRISAEHGRYLARSYSPWQLATSKDGTPLFEIYVRTGEVGEGKHQAMYLKHKAAAQDGKDMDSVENVLNMPMFLLTPEGKTSRGLINETLIRNMFSANPANAKNPMFNMVCSELKINMNTPTEGALGSGSGDSDGKNQIVIHIEFAVGSFKEESGRKSDTEVRRVPAVLERKGCFSICLTVDEDKAQQVGDNIAKGYRTIDHCIFDTCECLGKGKAKKNESQDEFLLSISTKAKNKEPRLFGVTTFNKINVTALSDPLTGLYTASNGFLVTEVIQFTRKFGRWQENGKTVGPSKVESYDYVEAVKLTGDFDVPAGQVAFRARVGEKYKLPPGSVLEKKFGAVARYKGKGRLTGFQKSGWVNMDLFILGEKYRKDGFAIGFLCSASKYHVLKLFKQLTLPSFPISH